MIEKLQALLTRGDSFVLTTHDPADADGLGAQIVLARALRGLGKKARILNASAIPERFAPMDPAGEVEVFQEAPCDPFALIIVDTADEGIIGRARELVPIARETFVIDHHDLAPGATVKGISDPGAASSSELALELALALGARLDPDAAFAAYVGIAYDTGFFSYSKTGPRSHAAAIRLIDRGASSSKARALLYESAPARALLLQKAALASLELECGNKVALQILLKEDFERSGALSSDTDGFVNFPLSSSEVLASIFVKETPEGKVKCSLRSKGALDVARVAREMGGGGHVNASGFESALDPRATAAFALAKIKEAL